MRPSGHESSSSVVCLGSGAALTSGRLYSSLLIDGEILLDLPPTAVPQLYRLGQDLTRIHHIFISHLHGDHVFGLPFFLLDYCVRIEREQPLYIVGPIGLEAMSHQLCDLAWPEMKSGGFEPRVPIRYIEIDAEGAYDAGDIEFAAVPMRHFTLPAFGFRFTHNGISFGYTGDTEECEEIHRLLDGTDVAIVELTHAGGSGGPGHLDRAAVARLVKRLKKQRTRVVATHIGEDPEPIEGITVCGDGCTIRVDAAS